MAEEGLLVGAHHGRAQRQAIAQVIGAAQAVIHVVGHARVLDVARKAGKAHRGLEREAGRHFLGQGQVQVARVAALETRARLGARPAEVVLGDGVRVLGGDRPEGGRAIQLGGIAAGVAGVDVGQCAQVKVSARGLELEAAVQVGFERVVGQPVHAGVPVAHVPAGLAEGVVKAALQRGLDGLGLAGVLVLATELVVGGQADVAGKLGAGQQGERCKQGNAQGLDDGAGHGSSGKTK